MRARGEGDLEFAVAVGILDDCLRELGAGDGLAVVDVDVAVQMVARSVWVRKERKARMVWQRSGRLRMPSGGAWVTRTSR